MSQVSWIFIMETYQNSYFEKCISDYFWTQIFLDVSVNLEIAHEKVVFRELSGSKWSI